jgi:hypothetical protein
MQLYWTEFLLKEMQGKSTLHFRDQTTLKIGSTHPIWTSLSSTVSSVKKGTIKARLLTGTYLLETNKHKFSSEKESPLCKYCGTENHRVQRSIWGDCYVKCGVSVPKRLICEHYQNY